MADIERESLTQENLISENVSAISSTSDVQGVLNSEKITETRKRKKILPPRKISLPRKSKEKHLKNVEKIKSEECDKIMESSYNELFIKPYFGEFRKFACTCCGELFSKLSKVLLHNIIEHCSSTKTCHVCKKSFSKVCHLVTHQIEVHLRIKPFSCEKCDKNFASKRFLARHLAIHDGTRFPCKICNLSFSKRPELTVHRKKEHSFSTKTKVVVDKTCICQICGETVDTRYDLIHHIKNIHENVRTFECDECGKRFTQSYNVVLHKNSVHRRLRVPCNECGETFTSKFSLKCHISAKHEKTKYDCDLCDKSFSLKYCLNKHKRSKHSDLLSESEVESVVVEPQLSELILDAP